MAVRYGALCAVLAGATALALLAGCAVRPSPLTEQDTERRVAEDRRTLAANRPALDGPLTLHRAMAYALLFNLESRVRAMEQALALGELEVARLGLLPGLSARYGVTTRSNVRASSSRSVLTGRESLSASTSSDRTTRTGDLTAVCDTLPRATKGSHPCDAVHGADTPNLAAGIFPVLCHMCGDTCLMVCSFIALGRPPLRPRLLAAARPARVFSTISSRWNSSKAAVI